MIIWYGEESNKVWFQSKRIGNGMFFNDFGDEFGTFLCILENGGYFNGSSPVDVIETLWKGDLL